jgi:hypothetical protein
MPTAAINHGDGVEAQADPHLILLEFWQEGYSADRVRVAMNNEDVTHDGKTYTKSAIQFTPPKSDDKGGSRSLNISNVDRILGKKVLHSSGKIRCRFILVSRADHDVAVWDTSDLLVIYSSQVNRVFVSGDFGMKPDPQMPYPPTRTPKRFFPGVYLP